MKFNIYFSIASPVTSIKGVETPCVDNPIDDKTLTELLQKIVNSPPKLVHPLTLVGIRIESVE